MFKNYKQQFEAELEEIKDSGMWKEVGVLEGKQGTVIEVFKDKGSLDSDALARDDKPVRLVNFCANNYLGLASSDELAEAAIEGIKKY